MPVSKTPTVLYAPGAVLVVSALPSPEAHPRRGSLPPVLRLALKWSDRIGTDR